jgi:hypothetical protein
MQVFKRARVNGGSNCDSLKVQIREINNIYIWNVRLRISLLTYKININALSSTKMQVFKRARVNGGSNYDSLKVREINNIWTIENIFTIYFVV